MKEDNLIFLSLPGVPQTVTIEHISPDSLVSSNNYKVLINFA